MPTQAVSQVLMAPAMQACPSVCVCLSVCVYALLLLLQVIPQQCEDGLKARTESSTVAWLVDKVSVCVRARPAVSCLLNACTGHVAALPCLHASLHMLDSETNMHACALHTRVYLCLSCWSFQMHSRNLKHIRIVCRLATSFPCTCPSSCPLPPCVGPGGQHGPAG